MEQEELIGGVTKGVAEETEVALWSIVPGGGRRMAPPGRWLAPITWTLPNQTSADAGAYLWDGFLGQILETTNWPV